MTNLCNACGANLDMVGRSHRCVPRNTPEASGTARKASSGSLLGGPSRNSVRASPHPVAKATEAKPSGLDAKGPSKTPVIPADRVVSRLGAGRTAQDVPQSSPAGAVAIPKRGRPRKPVNQLSRASRYRRKREAEKAK